MTLLFNSWPYRGFSYRVVIRSSDTTLQHWVIGVISQKNWNLRLALLSPQEFE